MKKQKKPKDKKYQGIKDEVRRWIIANPDKSLRDYFKEHKTSKFSNTV